MDGLDVRSTVPGAAAMVEAYRLVHRASLASRHTEGRAIDMTLPGWKGTCAELDALGRSYGLHPSGRSAALERRRTLK